MRGNIFLLAVSAIIFSLFLAGCSEENSVSALPDYVTDAAHPGAVEAYEYAVSHGDYLEYIPCYCNCQIDPFYHENVKDCFINNRESTEEQIVYDPHGAG